MSKNWRGAVHSALCGKHGQAFLREMNDSLDKLETKRLIAKELEKERYRQMKQWVEAWIS